MVWVEERADREGDVADVTTPSYVFEVLTRIHKPFL